MIRAICLIWGATAIAACASAEAPSSVTPTIAENQQEDRDVDMLNSIASVVIDSASLQREAAETAESADLRQGLYSFAAQLDELAEEFQKEIARRGGVPTESGQALGLGHRIFADIRSVFADDDKVASREVVRAQRYLVEEMQNAQNDPDASASARSFVQARVAEVKKIRDEAEVLARANGADV